MTGAALLSDRTRNAVVALVAVVWVVNIAAAMVSSTYEPDPSVNGVFSGVIGAVFAAGAARGKS